MSWDFFSRASDSPKGVKAVRAYLTKTMTFENERLKSEVLTIEKVGIYWFAAVKRMQKIFDEDGADAYLAQCYQRAADDSYVAMFIFETKYERGCFGYQLMDETDGPTCAFGAPESVLKLLSPLAPLSMEADLRGAEFAAEWRQRNANLAAIKAAPEGTKLKLHEPAMYRGGKVEVTEVFIKSRKTRTGQMKRSFYAPAFGGLVGLPDWRVAAATIVA